jgi:enoyl-CoA hydratase/carnithine racemase
MATVSFNLVRIDRGQHFLHLRLNRPERYNAIDSQTLRSLTALLDDHHQSELPLIIEGEAEAFSVGADITELAGIDAKRASAYSMLGHEVLQALERWPGVTIAALSGYTLGVGLELALGCDVLVGRPNLRLGLPGLAWALVPCMGGLRRLACRVSESFSSDLFLNGDVLDADQALKLGLIDRLVHTSQDIEALAYDMGEYTQSAVLAIRQLRLARQGVIDSALGARMFSQPFASGECQRRLKALLVS